VQDLESGLQHGPRRIERRSAAGIERRAERVGESPPFGVGENVEFYLANAVIKLSGQIRVTVFEAREGLRVARL
jgi:hypothetical protein